MTEWWEDLYLCDVFDESFQKQIKDNIFLAKLLWSFKVFASVNQLHDKFCAFKKYFSLKSLYSNHFSLKIYFFTFLNNI